MKTYAGIDLHSSNTWVSLTVGTKDFSADGCPIIKTTNLKIIAVLPFTAGILLLLRSSASHYPWFIRLIGIFAIIKGAFIFSNPNEIANKLNDWYLNSLSDQTFRLFGIIAILLGSAVFSWVL